MECFTINVKLLSITLSGSGRLSRIDSLDASTLFQEIHNIFILHSLTRLRANFHSYTQCENNNKIRLTVLSLRQNSAFFLHTCVYIYIYTHINNINNINVCVFVTLYKRKRTEGEKESNKKKRKEPWTIESSHVGTAKEVGKKK